MWKLHRSKVINQLILLVSALGRTPTEGNAVIAEVVEAIVDHEEFEFVLGHRSHDFKLNAVWQIRPDVVPKAMVARVYM